MKPSRPLVVTATQQTHPTNGGDNDFPQLDGNRVAARRWKLNLSQTQLGERLGCCASRVCHLENERPHRVTAQTLRKLADALDCAPADLILR